MVRRSWNFRGFFTTKGLRAPKIFVLVFGGPGAGVGGISLKQGVLGPGKNSISRWQVVGGDLPFEAEPVHSRARHTKKTISGS